MSEIDITTKIIVIEAITETSKDYSECSDCSASTNISTYEYGSFEQLFDERLKNEGFRKYLKNRGIVFLDEIESREKRAIAQKQYFFVDNSCAFSKGINKIDIDNIDNNTAQKLGNEDCHIVQKISNEILPEAAYAIYQKAKKQRKTQLEAQKKAAETRKENQKLKEVKKAQKMLEKAKLIIEQAKEKGIINESK